jgi:hypothetical protein
MSYIDDLRTTVNRVAPLLREISDDQAAQKPAPERWSPKEVIGHLIDSACNNHGRFVRAQLQDDMVFPTYAQDAWIECQSYQSESWNNLITLWHAYNLHIAHLMSAVSDEELMRARARHNVDRIGFQQVPAEQPTTLDHLMRDYVDHLKHHLVALVPLGDVE